MRMMLERAGFTTEEAGTAVDALNRIRDAVSPFAVVLLDYVAGPGWYRSSIGATSTRAHTRIVLTSGRAEEDMPNHGADGYLPKPFTKEQLVGAVRAATAAAQG